MRSCTTCLLAVAACLTLTMAPRVHAQPWTADNGNGTFTNPLFFDEFSDPDTVKHVILPA
jgi:hypothetical protein